MEKYGDPIGKAITDFTRSKRPDDIIVCSEICEDDIIPIEVLFRNEDEMPELEVLALQNATGKILDVGAGAGTHANYLQNMGKDVTAIDISEGAVAFMQTQGLKSKKVDFFDLKNE